MQNSHLTPPSVIPSSRSQSQVAKFSLLLNNMKEIKAKEMVLTQNEEDRKD